MIQIGMLAQDFAALNPGYLALIDYLPSHHDLPPSFENLKLTESRFVDDHERLFQQHRPISDIAPIAPRYEGQSPPHGVERIEELMHKVPLLRAIAGGLLIKARSPG